MCGKIGHIERECELRYELGVDIDPENFPYGPWLREAVSSQCNTRPRESQPLRSGNNLYATGESRSGH